MGLILIEWHMAGTNMLYVVAIFNPVKTGYFKTSITMKKQSFPAGSTATVFNWLHILQSVAVQKNGLT